MVDEAFSSSSLVVVVAAVVSEPLSPSLEDRVTTTDVLTVAEVVAALVPVRTVVREVVRSLLSSSPLVVAEVSAAVVVVETPEATAAVKSGALPKAVTMPDAA